MYNTQQGVRAAVLIIVHLPAQWGTLEFHRRSLRNLQEAMRKTRKLCAIALDTINREVQIDERGWPVHEGKPFRVEKGDKVRPARLQAALPWRTLPPPSVPHTHPTLCWNPWLWRDPCRHADAGSAAQITITTAPGGKVDEGAGVLPISYPGFPKMVQKGDTVFLGRYLVTGSEDSSTYLTVHPQLGLVQMVLGSCIPAPVHVASLAWQF